MDGTILQVGDTMGEIEIVPYNNSTVSLFPGGTAFAFSIFEDELIRICKYN